MKTKLLSFFLLFAGLLCTAQPGSFDTTFGTGGKVTTSLGTAQFLYDIALQPDGKMIGVGNLNYNGPGNNFFVVRYTQNGVYDTTFGTNGLTTTNYGTSSGAEAVALQPDGKIVAVGHTSNQQAPNGTYSIMAVRYNADGTQDTTFNGTGIFILAGPGHAYDVAIQPDGKILIGGSVNNNAMVMRLTANGTADAAFGDGGMAFLPFSPNNNYGEIHALTILSDGSILAAGRAGLTAGIVKYTQNGVPDTTFGTGGGVLAASFSAANSATANAITVAPNNDILVTGSASNGTLSDGIILKFDAAGTPVTSFADNGVLMKIMGEGIGAFGQSIAVSNNKILVGYTVGPSTNYDFNISAYTINGQEDTTFGNNGSTSFYFAGATTHDYLRSMLLQPDGKILCGGYSWNGISIARLIGVDTEPVTNTASVCGSLYNDLNEDGIQQDNEAGLEGIVISIIEAPAGQEMVTITTDANGNYCFTGLSAGQYSFQVTVPEGWEVEDSSGGYYIVDVNENSTNPGFSFGLRQTLGAAQNKGAVFSLYPNPATAAVHIHLANQAAANVTVFTITGAAIFSQRLTAADTVIDTRSYAAGSYFAAITTADGQKAVMRFIVVR